jgi:hypothetical protein
MSSEKGTERGGMGEALAGPDPWPRHGSGRESSQRRGGVGSRPKGLGYVDDAGGRRWLESGGSAVGIGGMAYAPPP